MIKRLLAAIDSKVATEDRKLPGYRCDHKGCRISFRTKRERIEHLFNDSHCKKCGFGHSERYSWGSRVPAIFAKAQGYCKACEFNSGPVFLEDDEAKYEH